MVQTSATAGGGSFSHTSVMANKAPAAAYKSRHHSRSQSPMRSGIGRKTRALTEKQTTVAMASEMASEISEPIRASTTCFQNMFQKPAVETKYDNQRKCSGSFRRPSSNRTAPTSSQAAPR